MENLVLYDWVSITSKIHTPEQIISLIGMDSVTWETIKGAHGYRDRLYWNCISIHFNGSPDQGVWLEMSGQGFKALFCVCIPYLNSIISQTANYATAIRTICYGMNII